MRLPFGGSSPGDAPACPPTLAGTTLERTRARSRTPKHPACRVTPTRAGSRRGEAENTAGRVLGAKKQSRREGWAVPHMLSYQLVRAYLYIFRLQPGFRCHGQKDSCKCRAYRIWQQAPSAIGQPKPTPASKNGKTTKGTEGSQHLLQTGADGLCLLLCDRIIIVAAASIPRPNLGEQHRWSRGVLLRGRHRPYLCGVHATERTDVSVFFCGGGGIVQR